MWLLWSAMTAAKEAAQTGQLLAATAPPNSMPRGLPSDMNEWTFNIWTVDSELLPQLAFFALTSHPELSAPISQIDKNKLWLFVNEVAARYHVRPFHSFRHAVDVLLAASTLLRTVRRDHPEVLADPVEAGALLVAALVHDTNHPGCMNSYLVATSHPLAAETPQSVLERHHTEVALALLDREPLDFLSALPADKRSRFITLVRDAVLATDVTTTMPAMKAFTATVSEGKAPETGALMAMLIKAADISNPARSLKVYQRWIDGVVLEFFAQGDAEKARGLPISMNCDRQTVEVPKAQVGFITFLVGPLFEALHLYTPSLSPIVKQLEANRAHFANATPAMVQTPATGAADK